MSSKQKQSANNNSNFQNNKNISIPKYSPAYKFCQKIQEINKVNENGYTPIYSSILSENIEALNDLLILGADPNIQNFLGETPLHLSVKKNDLDSLFLLLKYNCDCNIQNKKGNTPLHLAIENNYENIIHILLRNKANPNIKNRINGRTATHLAVIKRLDETIMKLFKENNAEMFLVKDKYNKSPFDYAKNNNDEYYIHLLIKIFRNNKSFNSNKYIDKQMQTWNEKKSSKNKKNNINENTENNMNILNYSEKYSYKNKLDLDKNSSKKTLIKSEKNNKDIKLEENSYSSSNQNIIKISDKNIYTHGRAIVSSDLCSNNIQIKELNNSYENSIKSKKSSSGFLEDDINNLNIISYKPNNDEVNNKENINVSNLKNTFSHANSIKSEKSNNSELSKNKYFRNSENSNNSVINNSKILHNNINFSHSSSLNNSNKSNKTNNSQNIYQTNSICANRKIIKSIINDTVKKIVVKTISSSDGGDNDGNLNLLSKDSIHNIEDNKEDKIENITIKDEISINPNNGTNTNKDYNIETNNYIDNTVNLYENGTTSFVLYKNKNSSDSTNNIMINNLGTNNDNKSINISNIYDEINLNTNSNKSKNNANEYISDNNINRNKTINLNKINYKENTETKNILNMNSLNSLNNIKDNDNKDNIFLSSTNSHIFSELNMNSNTNNYNLTNNNISLSYSKNFQSEEDYNSSNNKNNIYMKNSDEKANNEFSDNKAKTKIFSNLNLDFNVIDENEEKNESNKNKNSLSNNILHGSNCTIKEINEKNINNNNNHKKKVSNGKVNQSKEIITSTVLKKSKSFMDSTSQKKNSFNKSLYSPSELEKINDNENTKDKNKTNIYKKHHRQLSYHLNYKSYLNSNKDNKEKESQKNDINNINIMNINNNANINNTSLSASKNDIIYKNKNNLMNSLINNSITKSKSKTKTRNINNISMQTQNDGNNKVSAVNKSIRSTSNNINNTVTHNINTNNTNSNNINESNINLNINNSNNNSNQNKKNIISSVANTMNNTAFSTINRIKNSPSRQSKNTNKNNIPVNNKYNSNNYIFNDDLEYLDEELCDNIKLNNIPTNILMRLRDWLISCDLLCYYNIFIIRNMYNIDSYIHDIQEGNTTITYKDIEKIGIRKPGHIFRILIKLEIDSGIIDNNLFEYIVERINYYSNTTTLALTSSINDINCCGMNLCNGNNNKHPIGNNKKTNKNNELFFNDLSSFLRNYNIYKFKGNFLYNGFDRIEYVIIQLFSKYAFNKQILNDCLHVYVDKDKIKLLSKLYQVKKRIAKEYGIEVDENELNKILNTTNKCNRFEKKQNKINNNYINFNASNNSSIQKSNDSFYNNISNNNSKEQENNKENESNNFCIIF